MVNNIHCFNTMAIYCLGAPIVGFILGSLLRRVKFPDLWPTKKNLGKLGTERGTSTFHLAKLGITSFS